MPDAASPTSRWDRPSRQGFRALRHQNYQFLFVGQVATSFGFWLGHVTLQGLVHDLSGGDARQQSFLFLAMFLPAIVVAPIAGTIVDRHDRRRVLQVCYFGSSIFASSIAVSAFADNTSTALIFALVLPLGMFQAAIGPAQSAAVATTVQTGDLTSAISLQAVVGNLSRVAGPIIAAPLIAAHRYEWGITMFAVGSVLGVAATIPLQVHSPKAGSGANVFGRIAAGWRHAQSRPPAVSILATMAALSTFGVSQTVLMPDFTEDALGEPSGRFGWLIAALGVGAVIGALLSAYDKRPTDLSRAGWYFSMYAVTFAAFAFAPNLPLAMAGAAVEGLFYFRCVTVLQTIIQQVVDDDARGRVMSLFQICWSGLVPLGTLAVGFMAESIGIRETMFGCACVCLAASVIGRRGWPGLR